MKKLLSVAGIACFIGFGANAASLSIDDGSITAGNIPGDPTAEDFSPNNNVLDTLGIASPLGGYFGATVSASQATIIRVEVFGAEAAASNTFSITGMGGTESYNHDGTPWVQIAPDLASPLAVFDVVVGAGDLDFEFNTQYIDFSTTPFTPVDVTVANGANPNTNTGENFFATFGPGADTDTTGSSLWLFFDDNGTQGDNHDDLVVRISTVPLPASMLLLGGALGGLGLMRRRRKQA